MFEAGRVSITGSSECEKKCIFKYKLPTFLRQDQPAPPRPDQLMPLRPDQPAPLRSDQPVPLGLDQSAPLRPDQLMPLRRDQPHLSGWASQRLSDLTSLRLLSGQNSPRLLSGRTSPCLLSGRTRLCLLDQTSHRLVCSWILSWLGWATRLSAGGVLFGCVPFIMMSHLLTFHSLHLCVGKHQFLTDAEHQPPPDMENQHQPPPDGMQLGLWLILMFGLK